MAKPRKSRRLCGSLAVFSVFNILFSQRHYVVTRLQAPSRPCDLRQPSAGPGRSIPSCAAMPERYRQHVFQGRLEEVVGRRSVEGASTWRTSRLRNRHRSVDQCQQRYRRDQLSHDGSPSGAPHDHGNGKLDHKVRQTSRFVQTLQHRAHRRCLAALFTGR